MTQTASHLNASRSAHQQAKGAHRAGNKANARELYAAALKYRLAARASDPDHADEAWLEDARHPVMFGEKERRYLRVPGLTVQEVAIKLDADLERFYREQTGEVEPQALRVEHPEVVTPKEWRETKAGAVDEDGVSPCGRGHRMQLISFDQRVCQICGRIDELQETKAVEDTEAFAQAQKERAGRNVK